MKKLAAILLALFIAVPGLKAQEADSIAKIQADFKEAGTADDKIDAKEMVELAGRALALAKAKKGRVGFMGCQWTFYICKIGEGDAKERKKLRQAAVDLAIERYINSPSLRDLMVEWQAFRPEDVAELSGYFDQVIAKTTKEGNKAAALEGKMQLLVSKDRLGQKLSDAESKELLDYWKKLVAEKGDQKNPNDRAGRTYKESLAGPIFVMENLSIGKVAPDIVGKDEDGVAFKLSDYRGKVVVLDFWGHW